jgi:hypothetical protein
VNTQFGYRPGIAVDFMRQANRGGRGGIDEEHSAAIEEGASLRQPTLQRVLLRGGNIADVMPPLPRNRSAIPARLSRVLRLIKLWLQVPMIRRPPESQDDATVCTLVSNACLCCVST